MEKLCIAWPSLVWKWQFPCLMFHIILFFTILQSEKMKNFDFDDWRRRYMRWMNHNKSRVMDFFRRQDKDHDGKVTRQEFIDGIMASSKFHTNILGKVLLWSYVIHKFHWVVQGLILIGQGFTVNILLRYILSE